MVPRPPPLWRIRRQIQARGRRLIKAHVEGQDVYFQFHDVPGNGNCLPSSVLEAMSLAGWDLGISEQRLRRDLVSFIDMGRTRVDAGHEDTIQVSARLLMNLAVLKEILEST